MPDEIYRNFRFLLWGEDGQQAESRRMLLGANDEPFYSRWFIGDDDTQTVPFKRFYTVMDGGVFNANNHNGKVWQGTLMCKKDEEPTKMAFKELSTFQLELAPDDTVQSVDDALKRFGAVAFNKFVANLAS